MIEVQDAEPHSLSLKRLRENIAKLPTVPMYRGKTTRPAPMSSAS
jgi:hypothetical protein